MIYFVQAGGVAVCEPTSFSDPILIYGKGAVLNLYNVVLNDTINFKYISLSESSFTVESSGEIHLNLLEWNTYSFSDKIGSKIEKTRLRRNSKSPTQPLKHSIIEIYSIDTNIFLPLLEFYPKTEEKLQKYALAQIEHLNKIRKLKHHLHPANYIKKDPSKA